MVSEFVFILTVVLSVRPVVFTVGERKSLRILFMCVGTAVYVLTFLQCALHPLYINWGINWQSVSDSLLANLHKNK
jgi:hypothetical protein